ncbi:MAG: hypothetical protein QOJ19_2942 [Acidimicrobiia bacterium]|jgi:hypothetical protein|nr:hypothetical protein [Acidimicrobiia bacterium]
MSTLDAHSSAGEQPASAPPSPASELGEFYDRYIQAFNARDEAAFASFFHLPVTVVHAPRYDERRAGRPLPSVTEPASLLGSVPSHWARSTVDQMTPLGDLAGFAPLDGLVERDERRLGIVATATRWNKYGQPYQQINALYVLTREGGQLGIKVLVELAVADLPSRSE